jgi:hypothetical protein
VIAHVLGHGAVLVSAGIAVGILGAAALTRLLSSFLYEVGAVDPIAFTAAGRIVRRWTGCRLRTRLARGNGGPVEGAPRTVELS